MKAEYQDNPETGLKRAQLRFSMYQAAKFWNMTPKQVRYFLTRCLNEKDILWDRGNGGRPENCAIGTGKGTGKGTVLGLVTILKYDKYQPEICDRGTGSLSANGAFLKEEEKKKKEKKKKPDSGESVSPNSQVYNFYIEEKRRLHNKPEWMPTATQAKQLRANIKVLIEKQGFIVDDLLSWLKNFFSDDKIKEAGWPWKFFMTDPVRWKVAREPSPTPPAHRKWDPKNERM